MGPILTLMTAGVLIRCDELDMAERWAQRGMADARATGSAFGLAGTHYLLGDVALRRGKLSEAVTRFETALRLSSEYGAEYGVLSSLTGLVHARIETGALDEAVAALSAAGLSEEAPPRMVPAGELLEARGRLNLARGELDASLRDLTAAAEHFAERGDAGPGISSWRLGAARVRSRLGEDGPACRLAADGLDRARRFGGASALCQALRVAAEVGAGDHRSLYAEAVEIAAGAPNRLEHASALIALGGSLRRDGERAAARRSLSEGLEIARRSGAIPLAEHAYTELRASGARPRRIQHSGVDSLTPSEERVARLAAGGMRNREIAEELFVTIKTVEFHLNQTFRKLEINARTELAPALAERETTG